MATLIDAGAALDQYMVSLDDDVWRTFLCLMLRANHIGVMVEPIGDVERIYAGRATADDWWRCVNTLQAAGKIIISQGYIFLVNQWKHRNFGNPNHANPALKTLKLLEKVQKLKGDAAVQQWIATLKRKIDDDRADAMDAKAAKNQKKADAIPMPLECHPDAIAMPSISKINSNFNSNPNLNKNSNFNFNGKVAGFTTPGAVMGGVAGSEMEILEDEGEGKGTGTERKFMKERLTTYNRLPPDIIDRPDQNSLTYTQWLQLTDRYKDYDMLVDEAKRLANWIAKDPAARAPKTSTFLHDQIIKYIAKRNK